MEDVLINYVLWPLLRIIVVMIFLTLMVMALTYAERKVLGHIQVRLGPMRVGWHGLLQPVADTIKLLLKEDIIPVKADRLVYMLGPALAVIPSFVVFAVIPFGPPPYLVTDVSVALLLILSVSSVGVLGIIFGGWGSNSKYPFMGALRASAQMISYEVPMGLALISVLLMARSLSLVDIVQYQKDAGWWFVILQPVAFFIYLTCGFAETNRLPFDLPEAESELTAGFHTEYSGMRFAFYFLAEYINMVTISCLVTLLFFGGWLRPFPNVAWLSFLDYVPPIVWFFLKMSFFLYLYLWVRGTYPRYRFDQLMGVGWKYFLPLTIVNILVTAGVLLYFLK